jgi:peptidoglycan/LPS O-acetylase OafA/YrhL
MIFPFLVGPFLRLGRTGQGIATFLCFVGYALLMLYVVPLVTIPAEIPMVRIDPKLHTINLSYQYGFLRCLLGFVVGMMMYRGYQSGWGRAWLANGWVLLAMFLAMFACFHFAIPDVFTVALFPLMLLSAAYGSEGTDRFLGKKIMQRLGDWSFSIYLVHQPLAFLLFSLAIYASASSGAPATEGPPPVPPLPIAWAIALIYIGLVLLFSWLTYRFVEVPARGWINPARRQP